MNNIDDIEYRLGETVWYISRQYNGRQFKCIVIGKNIMDNYGYQYSYRLKPLGTEHRFENCSDGINQCVCHYMGKVDGVLKPSRQMVRHTI